MLTAIRSGTKVHRRANELMRTRDMVAQRFAELEQQMDKIERKQGQMTDSAPNDQWHQWATSVLHILQSTYGTDSSHYKNFDRIYSTYTGWWSEVEGAKGVFRAAKADWDGGYFFSLQNTMSGEILGDFVRLAREALNEGHKDVAAVLTSAALEDALKRYASSCGLEVIGRSMQDTVGALKAKSLISGAQKSLLDALPQVRNRAMHAEWDKITAESVGGMLGFVEQFLLSHFS